MAEAQDVDGLRRRGRRRLVGAVALALLAVIVLPMVFDPEPKQAPPPVSVRIPSEEDAGFQPKVTPKPAVAPPVAAVPETKATPARPGTEAKERAAPAKESEPAPAKPARPDEAERARAALQNAEYIVPVAALSNPDKVKELTERLSAAKVPYYTEPVATARGKVTRVRAGPFDTREAAQKAHERIRALGLKPGNVTTRSG
jgi:DedD protein